MKRNSSRERVRIFENPENFYQQLHFLQFRAREFCGRILRRHDEESETISWTRSTVSLLPRKKIHWSFFTKVHLRPRPLVRATLALKVFIKYIRGYHNKPKESVYARGD